MFTRFERDNKSKISQALKSLALDSESDTSAFKKDSSNPELVGEMKNDKESYLIDIHRNPQ